MNYDQLLEQLKHDLPQASVWTHGIIGWIILGLVAALVLVGIIWALNALAQVYGVWAAHKKGQADLANAANEQQIQVAHARGRLDAAELNKKAAIVEAEAVAQQIKAIGEELTKHDLFLRWQWIQMMEKQAPGATIYVPTEANLPILEAARRSPKPEVAEEE